MHQHDGTNITGGKSLRWQITLQYDEIHFIDHGQQSISVLIRNHSNQETQFRAPVAARQTIARLSSSPNDGQPPLLADHQRPSPYEARRVRAEHLRVTASSLKFMVRLLTQSHT